MEIVPAANKILQLDFGRSRLVCEILSPSTFRLDRTSKMTTYAKYGVGYAWLIDPIAQILEAYRLESGRWTVFGAFGGGEKARVEPFQEIEIDLGDLWPKAQ